MRMPYAPDVEVEIGEGTVFRDRPAAGDQTADGVDDPIGERTVSPPPTWDPTLDSRSAVSPSGTVPGVAPRDVLALILIVASMAMIVGGIVSILAGLDQPAPVTIGGGVSAFGGCLGIVALLMAVSE